MRLRLVGLCLEWAGGSNACCFEAEPFWTPLVRAAEAAGLARNSGSQPQTDLGRSTHTGPPRVRTRRLAADLQVDDLIRRVGPWAAIATGAGRRCPVAGTGAAACPTELASDRCAGRGSGRCAGPGSGRRPAARPVAQVQPRCLALQRPEPLQPHPRRLHNGHHRRDAGADPGIKTPGSQRTLGKRSGRRSGQPCCGHRQAAAGHRRGLAGPVPPRAHPRRVARAPRSRTRGNRALSHLFSYRQEKST